MIQLTLQNSIISSHRLQILKTQLTFLDRHKGKKKSSCKTFVGKTCAPPPRVPLHEPRTNRAAVKYQPGLRQQNPVHAKVI